MKSAKFNWSSPLLLAMIIALSVAACSKDTSIVPEQVSAKFELKLPAALEQAVPQEEITGYFDQLTEMYMLTPEGYKMVPIQIALDVTANSGYNGPDAGSPFSVTISGTGFDEELGVIQYFERIDMKPNTGILQGDGRIGIQEDISQSCVPDDPTLFFKSFPTESWNPLPKGNYLINAPVALKGGLEGYEGSYGEAFRSVTFIEGMFDKGAGYFLGYVYVPDLDVR